MKLLLLSALSLAASRAFACGPLVVPVAVDLECPFSRRALTETIPKLEKEFGGQVVFAVRAFPLAFHPNARMAARASLCAREQGYERAFVNAMLELPSADPKSIAEASARLGKLHGERGQPLPDTVPYSVAKMETCLADAQMETRIEEEIASLNQQKVSGTPAFLFPAEMIGGNRVEEVTKAIKKALGEPVAASAPTRR